MIPKYFPCNKPVAKNAFTLIELSIVLVIVGLITGGILVAQTLIHQAEIRNQIKQLQEYQTAYNVFKLKYSCVPGDCNNATTLFGTTDSFGNAINNGDGDGKIDTSYGGSFAYYPPGTPWGSSPEMWGATATKYCPVDLFSFQYHFTNT